jgi:hypothetical protein
MRIVASRLKPLNIPFAFVGGAVMCLLVDHPELRDFRRTKDVDVVVAAITYFEFAALEARLREAGFQHDTSEGAPICRWIVDAHAQGAIQLRRRQHVALRQSSGGWLRVVVAHGLQFDVRRRVNPGSQPIPFDRLT